MHELNLAVFCEENIDRVDLHSAFNQKRPAQWKQASPCQLTTTKTLRTYAAKASGLAYPSGALRLGASTSFSAWQSTTNPGVASAAERRGVTARANLSEMMTSRVQWTGAAAGGGSGAAQMAATSAGCQPSGTLPGGEDGKSRVRSSAGQTLTDTDGYFYGGGDRRSCGRARSSAERTLTDTDRYLYRYRNRSLVS